MRIQGLAIAAFSAALAVGGFGATQASAATTFEVSNIAVDSKDYKVRLTNPNGAVSTVYQSPQFLTQADNTLPLILLLCVDPFHFDHLGRQTPHAFYHIGELTTDFGGNALTDDQVGQLGWLYNQALLNLDDPFQLAGIQGAAWLVEDSSINFRGQTDLMTLTLSYFNDPHRVNPNRVFGLLSDDGHQSGVVTVPGVPEPAAWMLMIMGFSAAGTMLRRKRALA